MRYFTKSLWSQLNHCDATVRTRAEMAWYANCEKYHQEFEKTKKCISEDFLEEFLLRKGLHDYTFTDIVVLVDKSVVLCKLQSINERENVTVSITGVQSSKVHLNTLKTPMGSSLKWGYSEFSLTPDNTLNLCILGDDMESEFEFEFSSIAFLKSL